MIFFWLIKYLLVSETMFTAQILELFLNKGYFYTWGRLKNILLKVWLKTISIKMIIWTTDNYDIILFNLWIYLKSFTLSMNIIFESPDHLAFSNESVKSIIIKYSSLKFNWCDCNVDCNWSLMKRKSYFQKQPSSSFELIFSFKICFEIESLFFKKSFKNHVKLCQIQFKEMHFIPD